MSPKKAHSDGTKVDLGQKAPVKQEAAGTVASESLAAESYREGGAFASNVGAQLENLPASDVKKKSGSGKPDAATKAKYREGLHDTVSDKPASHDASKGSGRSENMPESSSGEAPSHVNTRHTHDGPKGKNLHEGFDDSGTRDGIKAAFEAEIGSKDDPSRLAENQFELRNNAFPQAANEGKMSTKTKYDGLQSDVSA